MAVVYENGVKVKAEYPDPLREEIARALRDLLNDYLEECIVDVGETSPATETADVELFSAHVKEEYMKTIGHDRQTKQSQKNKQSKDIKRKKKNKHEVGGKETLAGSESSSSSSSDEENMDLLAAIAVSAQHLGTSNKIRQLSNHSITSS